MNADTRPTGPLRRFARFVVRTLPTLLVLAALAAVAYWGHHTGWKAPRFADLWGSRAVQTEDWCAEHNVPDSQCIACHPELAGESGADWCKEHGVPESKCTICHPEILTTGVAGDWCREHGLPESGCTLCHPEIAHKGVLPPDPDATTVSAGDEAHGAKARSLRAAPDPSTCQKHALKVQFASSASLAKVGIHLGVVAERPMSDSIAVNAEVDYDRARFAKVASRVAGTAARVDVALGDRVHAGDVLGLVDSVEVGHAKAEFLQAWAAFDAASRTAKRVQSSSDAGYRTAAERAEAEAAERTAGIRLFTARQALANLGLTTPDGEPDAASITALGTPSAAGNPSASANLLALVAPLDGIIVGRSVVTGEVIEPAQTLFEIADTARMSVAMDVSQRDLARVSIGQAMTFRTDTAADDIATGRVTWIATAVDETTRTVRVRADVENSTGRLLAHSFGRARIVVRTTPDAIVVPTEALQWEGCCHVVFVRLADTIFQTRKVRLGTKDAAYTEILAGVLPGEVVVTRGSHVLKSEILKSSLGAGCCAEE